MKKLKKRILKYYKTKHIVILASIAMLAYVMMLINFLGLLSDFGTMDMFDIKIFYSPNFFYQTIISLNDSEVLNYLYLHVIDYIFIVTFYPCLTLLLGKNSRVKTIELIIPIIAMFSDLTENILIDIGLCLSIPSFLVVLLNIITITKFLAIGIAVVLIIYYRIKRN